MPHLPLRTVALSDATDRVYDAWLDEIEGRLGEPGADWSADLNCSYRRLHLPFAVTPSTQNKNGAVSTVAKQIYSLTLMGRQPSLGPPSLRSY